VRKSQISDKLQIFFAPRERGGEIPKQPKIDNVKILENVPLNDTFVPFINERSGIGHLIPKVSFSDRNTDYLRITPICYFFNEHFS
jgi:hypothetical protein